MYRSLLLIALGLAVANALVFDPALYFCVGDAGSGGTRFQFFLLADGSTVGDRIECDANSAMGKIDGAPGRRDAAAATWWTQTRDNCLLPGFATAGFEEASFRARVKEVAIYIRATAGMREAGVKTKVFDAVEAFAKSGPGGAYNMDVLIIGGNVEGLYGFQANLADMDNPKDTIYLEQGGASMQVAFQCPMTACSSDRLGVARGFRRLLSAKTAKQEKQTQLQTAKGYINDGTGNDAVCYFSESFMGYGQDELLALILVSGHPQAKKCLSSALTIQQANDGKVTGTFHGVDMFADGAVSFVRELEDQCKLFGNCLGAPITGVPDVAGCATVIEDVTMGTNNFANTQPEFRGFDSDDPNNNGDHRVPFSDRWGRIQIALTACHNPSSASGPDPYFKKTLFSNTAAWRGTYKHVYDGSDERAATLVNPDYATHAFFATRVDGKTNHDSFKPMVAGALIYFHKQLNSYAPNVKNPLDLHMRLKGNDWTPGFAAAKVAGKTFSYASGRQAADATGQPTAGKFIFASKGKGPPGSVNAPEMWQLNHAL